MGLELPIWWIIQLVCRVTFNSSPVSEPLHQLHCLYNTTAENRTIIEAGAAANRDENKSDIHHHQAEQVHRLYYRCIFNEENGKTEIRIADCQSTDPSLSLYTNDSQSIDLEQEFSKNVSLKVVNLTTDLSTIAVSPPTSSPVWLILPKFPYFNDTSFRNVRLKCDRFHEAEISILCDVRSEDGDDNGQLYLSRGKRKWTYIVAIVAIAGGGLGNILVCLAVCLDRSLQNVTNYFLLSLAVADLLVCLFVMPLGAIQGFFGYWPLGISWCNVYVSCDVLACSCSIMHMCCISLGRYLGIRSPFKTRHTYSTKRLVGYKITLVWALSLMVSSWVTFLGLHESKNIMPKPYQCVINNQTFLLFGSLVAFYIPMFIMIVTYTRTVQLLRKKAGFLQPKSGCEQEGPIFRHLGGGFRKPPSIIREIPTIPKTPIRVNNAQVARSLSTSHKCRTVLGSRATIKSPPTSISLSQPSLTSTTTRTNGAQQLPAEIQNSYTNNYNNVESTGRNARLRTLKLPLNVTTANLSFRFMANRSKRQNMAAIANVVRTEQKASKVLGLVFLTFVLCWAPFFLFNVFFILCDRSHCNQIPDHLVDLALWLGYISSTINPIIYTIFNRTFRSAFNRLLRCNCQRLSRSPRYRSVYENHNSTMMAQTPLNAAAVPLSLSLQGTPLLITPSSASLILANVRSPNIADSQNISIDFVESSTTTS